MAKRALILIIDDDCEFSQQLSYCLSGFSLDTATAKTAATGWRQCLELNPNLITSEIDLPDSSGFDLCRRLKAYRKTADIPFVFLTRREHEIDRIVGFEIGATDYVVKPVSTREVALRIRSILRRIGKTAASDSSRFDHVEIDMDQSLVIVDGQRLAVSQTEFDILAVLMKAKGRILSREEIINRVWKEPKSVMNRTVDAHIKSMRAKLANTGFRIVTVRKLGYGLRVGISNPSRREEPHGGIGPFYQHNPE